MYNIYIKNYKTFGVLQTTEQALYSIPISAAEGNALLPLIDPTVKTEMGKTGTFEFSMVPAHPYYNSLMQMKTIMRVEYDGDTLFRGRVLTIDNSPLTGERKIHLEGDLAFLMDSIQPKTKEEKRPSINITTYIQQILTNHNNQMAEEGSEDKKIYMGEVPGNYSAAIDSSQQIVASEVKQFGSGSWENSMTALESLAKEYGGYFRTRYVNGLCYLDWLEYCYRYTVNGQPIEVGENLIEINGSTEVENLFTALIPTGSSEGEEITIQGYRTDIHGNNNRILVPQIVGLFTDAELNARYHAKSDYQNAVTDYGIIYKSQNFPNADSQATLWNYAVEWIKDNYAGGITSFNLTAVDMHHLNGSVQKYLTGDRITVIYPDISQHTSGNTPKITKILTLTAVQYYLHNPEKNSYSAGIPNNILNKTYGSKKTGSSGGSSGSASSNIGGNNNNNDDFKSEVQKSVEEANQLAWNYILNDKYNGDLYREMTEHITDDDDRNVILKTTHMALYNGFMGASSSTPGSNRNRRAVRTVMMNGLVGRIEMTPGYGPMNDDPLGLNHLTDEQLDVANKYGQRIIIDSLTQELGFRGMSDVVFGTPDEIQQQLAKDRRLMKVGLTSKDLGSTKEDTPYVKLYQPQKVLNDLLPEAASMLGEDGSVNIMKTVTGKDGTGALGTIVQEGVTALTSHFDPSTVGMTGITPVKTAETDGANGSQAVGSGGDLGGWKITLNKPMTYNATIDGIQKTFTVQAGQVAATDMHFTKRYDSVYAELAVFDQMYADYAQIGALVALKATVNTINANYITADYIKAGFTATGSISAGGTITADSGLRGANLQVIGDASMASLTLAGFTCTNLIRSAELSEDGTSLILHPLYGTDVTFSKAATLTDAYGGDNAGITATYTVTGSPSGNFPSGSSKQGTFTLHINENAAWVTDPTGAIRARVDNTYSGDETAAYKQGWNDCIDNCSGEYYLSGYNTYNSSKVNLYVAPTGGAQIATGAAQVWRYGGSTVYRYGIPGKIN